MTDQKFTQDGTPLAPPLANRVGMPLPSTVNRSGPPTPRRNLTDEEDALLKSVKSAAKSAKLHSIAGSKPATDDAEADRFAQELLSDLKAEPTVAQKLLAKEIGRVKVICQRYRLDTDDEDGVGIALDAAQLVTDGLQMWADLIGEPQAASMSLRDAFAASALRPAYDFLPYGKSNTGKLAEIAYEIADAMMDERNKREAK
jgi:hypothetical protein